VIGIKDNCPKNCPKCGNELTHVREEMIQYFLARITEDIYTCANHPDCPWHNKEILDNSYVGKIELL